MIWARTAGEWMMFLDTADAEGAVGELRRLITRLDSSCDEITGVLRSLNGSPSAEVEEALRVSRTTAHEAAALLSSVITSLRLGDPDAA